MTYLAFSRMRDRPTRRLEFGEHEAFAFCSGMGAEFTRGIEPQLNGFLGVRERSLGRATVNQASMGANSAAR
jgi:hypothetical protein